MSEGESTKAEMLRGMCHMFLELEELFEAVQAGERDVDLLHKQGAISTLRYDLEKEGYKRQYIRLLAIIRRLKKTYDLAQGQT